MLDSVKRTALGVAAAAAIVAPVALSPLPAAAAPLAGEGSVAALMHSQTGSAVTDVRWHRHYGWGPGAFVAGATLGVLGAALAAPAYGYCGPYYYGYCGPYYNDYYAYYPGPYYGYGYYHPYYHRHYWHHWRHW